MSKKPASTKRSTAVKIAPKRTAAKGNHKPAAAAPAKATRAKSVASNGAATASITAASIAAAPTAAAPARLLPTGEQLKQLYARYTGGAAFDDHDKAFYFVLDVGGVSRARQLIQHVAEVLAELEEFDG